MISTHKESNRTYLLFPIPCSFYILQDLIKTLLYLTLPLEICLHPNQFSGAVNNNNIKIIILNSNINQVCILKHTLYPDQKYKLCA